MMYENIVNNIDEIVNLINGKITTHRTVLRLKNLKWEDSVKDIEDSRKDENVSNNELYDKFLNEIKLKDELDKYKKDTENYDNYIEFYNLIIERYEEKKREYKKLSDKKNELLAIKPKDKQEEERIKFQIDELNKDLAHIISNIQELVKPLNELKEKFNIKEELTKTEVKKENEDNKVDSKIKDDNEKSLEELADMMSIDEMNTILNMIFSSNRDQNILDSIAKRLGVDVARLEEIAKFKEKRLKEQEEVNDAEKQNDNAEEKKWNIKEAPKGAKVKEPQVDTKPEPIKKPTKIAQISNILKNKVNGKALIAVLAIAGTLAVFMANPALILAAGAGYMAKQFSDGKKL